jgi:hypothetical protein
MSQIALNLADLIANDEVCFAAGILLSDCRGPVVTVNRRALDGTAVVINAGETRARAIVQVLRMRYPRLRAYESTPRGAWKKIR